MRPMMGLHTKEEVGHALGLVDIAYNRALDAYEVRNPVAMAFEIGYIKAISDLASAESVSGPEGGVTRGLASITKDQVRRLDADLKKIL